MQLQAGNLSLILHSLSLNLRAMLQPQSKAPLPRKITFNFLLCSGFIIPSLGQNCEAGNARTPPCLSALHTFLPQRPLILTSTSTPGPHYHPLFYPQQLTAEKAEIGMAANGYSCPGECRIKMSTSFKCLHTHALVCTHTIHVSVIR